MIGSDDNFVRLSFYPRLESSCTSSFLFLLLYLVCSRTRSSFFLVLKPLLGHPKSSDFGPRFTAELVDILGVGVFVLAGAWILVAGEEEVCSAGVEGVGVLF